MCTRYAPTAAPWDPLHLTGMLHWDIAFTSFFPLVVDAHHSSLWCRVVVHTNSCGNASSRATMTCHGSRAGNFDAVISSRRLCPKPCLMIFGVIYPVLNDHRCPCRFSHVLEDCRTLWQTRTGVGIDLSQFPDPVFALWTLSRENHATTLLEGEKSRPRRGNMATLDVEHPRAIDFIRLKKTLPQGTISNFNISLRVTDSWMRQHGHMKSECHVGSSYASTIPLQKTAAPHKKKSWFCTVEPLCSRFSSLCVRVCV